MKIEDQVCNLKNAQKLAELGVKRISLLHHCKSPTTGGYYLASPEDFHMGVDVCPAYTVAELGEMVFQAGAIPPLKTLEGGWVVMSEGNEKPPCHLEGVHTEADARAMLVICLLRQGLLDVEKLNA